MAEPMSALDAEFLHMEDGVNHLQIAACAVFEGPPPSEDELEVLVAAALPRLRHYRQVARTPPLGLGRPVWVDDPAFDLRRHLEHVALPAPGGDDELRALVGERLSVELPRDRPLWATTLIDGLADGRWALLCQVHHAMVDGMAGRDLMEAMLADDADAKPGAPEPWQPAPEPSAADLLAGAATGFLGAVVGLARRATTALARPAQTVRELGALAGGLSSFGRELPPSPPTSIDGRIGPARCWTWASVPLEDVKRVRTALGGTVNDVVLTLVCRGFRDLLTSRGEDPIRVDLRTLVPVSMRALGGTAGNEVAALVAELPVAVSDPTLRYEAVRAELDRLKASHEIEAAEAATRLADLTPPFLLAAATRAIVAWWRRHPQRNVNTVATNVPGPQHPLYAAGRRMVAWYPYVPVAHGVRVGVAILSYDGWLHFGITGDARTAPDIQVVADGITAGIAELTESTELAA